MPGCNGSDRRQRALPERGADFRALWNGESVCRILSAEGKQVMRSANTDSAAFPGGRAWDQVDWPIVHRRVRGLQIRIVKATRDQNWRRVKALQRFLVNSYSAKALAVKRVSENDGKRTPGVDGEIWTTPEAKWRAIQRLDSRGLRPQPLRRVYIPKRGSTTKKRPLGIPAMIDRAQQALHLQGLEPVAETQADPHSYGFRRGRGTQDAIARVFNLLARKISAPWILEELLEREVKPCVEAFLAARGLELSQEKTRITHISEGFDFLGQNVRKYDGKLLIKPSARNVKAFLDKVRETIRANRSTKQEALIDLLNPMIRGWANYHRHVVAKRTYAAVDSHIWQALWRWARRRHPNKSCGWVRRKYFRTLDHQHWVFAVATRGYNGEPRILALLSATETRIVRHVRVKSDANPFDPVWDFYFAQRQRSRMLQRLQDRSFPKRLWQRQEGICPGCGQPIDDEDQWLIRLVVPIKAGGTRSLANLKMLHSTCQRLFRIANGAFSASDDRVPAP